MDRLSIEVKTYQKNSRLFMAVLLAASHDVLELQKVLHMPDVPKLVPNDIYVVAIGNGFTIVTLFIQLDDSE